MAEPVSATRLYLGNLPREGTHIHNPRSFMSPGCHAGVVVQRKCLDLARPDCKASDSKLALNAICYLLSAICYPSLEYHCLPNLVHYPDRC